MSNMVTHAMIIREDKDSPFQAPGRFILSGIQPFDQMKVVLEQAIYVDYLKLCSSTTTIKELESSVLEMYSRLPTEIYTDNTIQDSLYKSGYAAIKLILDKKYTQLLSVVPATELYQIYLTPPLEKYYNQLYVATLTETFLDQWLASTTGFYDADKYPEHVLIHGAVYRPSLNLADFRQSQNDCESLYVTVTLSPVVMSAFDLREASKRGSEDLSAYLSGFDMHNYSIEDLIGLYGAFSIDHDKYVMTSSFGTNEASISDICFDMITGSSYVSHGSAGSNRIVDLDSFKRFLSSQIKSGRLEPVNDSKLFGELLTRLGESLDIVNYFTKDINHISAQEAFAFRRSMLADFIKDRFAAMEADEEEADTDATVSGSDDTENSNEDTENATADLGGTDMMDSVAGNDSEDQKPKSVVQVKPQIDPNKMLLELANPQDEPMSDYIYREIVAQRINMLIKYPPKNTMPNDILMLKRWKSRWLYLASIACLRDFLTRISLRLSN